MTPSLTQDDIMDILEAFGDSGFAHLDLTVGSIRVSVNQTSTSAAPCVDVPADSEEVVAPLLGMFQAGPEAGAPAFVKRGSMVQADTTIGFIRVMHDLTPVKAGLRGTVLDVLVQDGQFVEFGQSLLRVGTESAAPGSCRAESNRANTP